MATSMSRTTTRTRQPTLFTPAFVTLSMASLAYFTAAGILLPVLPRFVEGPLGGGDVAVGLVFGTFGLTAVLLRPAAGIYGDRRGRRPLLLGGAVIFALSVLGYAVAPTTSVLILLRSVGGVGEALFFVGMLTTFSDLAPPQRRGEAMSLASLALYVGIGVGPLLGELASARSGYTAAWLLASGASLLAAALVRRVPETLPGSRRERRVEADARASTARGSRRFVHPAGVLPGVVLFTSITGMAGFLAFVPLHVADLGLGGAGRVMAVFAGVVVVVRSAGARLPDQLGPRRAIRLALTASVVGLLLVAAWPSIVGLVLGAVVLAVGIALLTPSVFALAAAAVPPEERGQVMATTSAFIDIAFGAGPVAFGLVAAAWGRPSVFAAGAVMAGVGLVTVLTSGLGRPGVRPPVVHEA